MNKLKAGHVLTNGATVIDHDTSHSLVFAYWHKGDEVEYMSWAYDANTGTTYWGDYYTGSNFPEACKSYCKRLGKTWAQ